MKKLIIKLSIIFIPLGLIIVVTNILVDPANIFSADSYVDKIANIMVSGNNVDNIINYNERLLQEKFLLKQTTKPNVIVMGSSRIMEVSDNVFPDKTLLNIGVSHANINDLIALAGLIDSLKLLPQQVVINLDQQLICGGTGNTTEWESLKQYHSYFLKKICHDNTEEQSSLYDNVLKKYYTMLTFEYFQSSIEFLLKRKNKEIKNVGKNTPIIYGRYSNGSIAYPYSYTHPDTTLVSNIATTTGIKEKVSVMDENKVDMLNCLVNYFQKNNVKIIFVLMPFHQQYYNAINKRQNNIIDTYETFFINFAKQHNSPIYGSLSAIKAQTPVISFYDPYHINGSAIKQIFQKP